MRRAKREYPRQLHLTITGAEANTWVLRVIHGTELYIDQDKRIRRSA
jgi:hypothetical protein